MINMISIRIRKEAKKEKSIKEHIETIYSFLYQIADEIEEMESKTGNNDNGKNIKFNIKVI